MKVTNTPAQDTDQTVPMSVEEGLQSAPSGSQVPAETPCPSHSDKADMETAKGGGDSDDGSQEHGHEGAEEEVPTDDEIVDPQRMSAGSDQQPKPVQRTQMTAAEMTMDSQPVPDGPDGLPFPSDSQELGPTGSPGAKAVGSEDEPGEKPGSVEKRGGLKDRYQKGTRNIICCSSLRPT